VDIPVTLRRRLRSVGRNIRKPVASIMEGPNMAKHPGFKAVQSKIAAKEGVSKARAGAMLAASTRRASAGAKKKNPHLKRVKG
jgi:hypothetical protein